MQNENTTNRERAQVYRNGLVIGAIVNDVFRKHVDASRHFLRRPPAICFDLDSLAQARANGARFVEVIDRESGAKYRASLDRIWKRGFHVSRGAGAQLALALSEWNQDDEPTADQLTLWG